MSLQELLDKVGNRIELPYLGLSFRKFGHQVFHDGEFSSPDEFYKKLKSWYGIVKNFDEVFSYKEINGVCAGVKVTPGFGIPSKTNLHIATFPDESVPAELKGQYKTLVLGHEETHALFIMEEFPRLATEMDNFAKPSNSMFINLLCPFLDLPNGKEYVCDIGGIYALVRAMKLSPDAFKRGLRKYFFLTKEILTDKTIKRTNEGLTLEVLAEMGVR